MNATTRRPPALAGTTPIPTPRRFLRCIACGTGKKERPYALCAECYRVNGTLPVAWFGRWARLADREEAQYGYRSHPLFGKACRVYSRRRQRAESRAALDASLPRLRGRQEPTDDRFADEACDGLGPYEPGDLLDWQMHAVELPEPERSGHRELSDSEIARWDARVDAWAVARGFRLASAPAPEILPWGYAMEIEGALVWTEDP